MDVELQMVMEVQNKNRFIKIIKNPWFSGILLWYLTTFFSNGSGVVGVNIAAFFTVYFCMGLLPFLQSKSGKYATFIPLFLFTTLIWVVNNPSIMFPIHVPLVPIIGMSGYLLATQMLLMFKSVKNIGLAILCLLLPSLTYYYRHDLNLYQFSNQNQIHHQLYSKESQKIIYFSPKDSLLNEKSQLSKLDSGYVLLDFWSIYCGHCLEIMPQFEILADEWKDSSNIRFFAVSSSKFHEIDHNRARSIVANISVPQIIDSSGSFVENLKVEGVPTWILLKDGKVLQHTVGCSNDFKNTMPK